MNVNNNNLRLSLKNKILIADSAYGRNYGWQVERPEGVILAHLVERVETDSFFWDSYRILPVNGHIETLKYAFWYPDCHFLEIANLQNIQSLVLVIFILKASALSSEIFLYQCHSIFLKSHGACCAIGNSFRDGGEKGQCTCTKDIRHYWAEATPHERHQAHRHHPYSASRN